MIDNERSSAIHTDESVEEKISLSDRFGLWIGFHKLSQIEYLKIIESYCEFYKMQFNENKNQFEAVLKLKQGFYNYKYLIDNEIYKNDNKSVGGNFDETENVYSVLVYYRDYGERYDRIVGFGKGSSEFITN